MERRGPLYIIPWRITSACDSSCLYCASANKPPASDELNTNEALHLVDQIYDFGASWLGISGGEPLLRRDLFEIIRYAKKIGLNVSIITNGRYLDGKIFDEIVKNEVHVSVGIDGTETTNDLIRGKGAYADAVSAIEKLSRERLLNCLVYTFVNINESATNVNVNDITHVLDLAAKYGARWVIYHSFIPYSKDKNTLKADPSPQQYEWAGTSFMIYVQFTRENQKSMFIVPSSPVWQNKEDYPTSATGLTISFSAVASSENS